MTDFRYQRKPLVVEAFRNDPEAIKSDDTGMVPAWFVKAISEDKIIPTTGPAQTGSLTVYTPRGIYRVDPGDWIILTIEGELEVCKPDEFEKTYEKVAG